MSGWKVPWHQDGERCRSVWLPLDDVDEENGTLQMLSGWHRRGRQRFKPVATEEEVESAEFFQQYHLYASDILDDDHGGGGGGGGGVDSAVVTCNMGAGGLEIHHPLTPHSSSPNTSTTREYTEELCTLHSALCTHPCCTHYAGDATSAMLRIHCHPLRIHCHPLRIHSVPANIERSARRQHTRGGDSSLPSPFPLSFIAPRSPLPARTQLHVLCKHGPICLTITILISAPTATTATTSSCIALLSPRVCTRQCNAMQCGIFRHAAGYHYAVPAIIRTLHNRDAAPLEDRRTVYKGKLPGARMPRG